MRPERDPAPEWAVCVYCASTPEHPELLELASELGEAIAERGWTLVWGGGRVSAMGAVASAARARGGRTVGVIPQNLMCRELADSQADELIVSDTMHERKQVMERLAEFRSELKQFGVLGDGRAVNTHRPFGCGIAFRAHTTKGRPSPVRHAHRAQ